MLELPSTALFFVLDFFCSVFCEMFWNSQNKFCELFCASAERNTTTSCCVAFTDTTNNTTTSCGVAHATSIGCSRIRCVVHRFTTNNTTTSCCFVMSLAVGFAQIDGQSSHYALFCEFQNSFHSTQKKKNTAQKKYRTKPRFVDRLVAAIPACSR